MRYRLLYMLLLLLAPQVMTAQNYEYWLDNDYAGRVSKYGELGEVSFEVDVSMLNPGIHYLNCRGRQQKSVTSGNSYDAWGTIKRTMFYVIDTKNSEQPIRVEYWLDSDYAGRVSEATSGGAVAIEKSLSELTSGIHYLNVRSLGAAGQWGTIKRTMFYVDHSVKSFANVRCWIDDVPATAVTQKVEGGTVSLSIDVSELNAGDHTLYVQGMGSDGDYADIRSFAFQNSTDINEPANQRISLQEVPFRSYTGWGVDAQVVGAADCAWVLNEPTGVPYGDGSVINRADLSHFSKLRVVATEGTPRFLLNRDMDEGQWSEDENESHMIEYPKEGWSEKYFTKETTTEGDVYTVDLKQIKNDKGFVYLHAIKGANWADVTVSSMEVELDGDPQVSIAVNGEGTVGWSTPTGVGEVGISNLSELITTGFDSELNLTFTPNTGYHLLHVFVNDINDYVNQVTGNSLTLHITQDTNIRVVFEMDTNKVPLTAADFYKWDGWGPLAQIIDQGECQYVLGEPAEIPYGDSDVRGYVDLSSYSRLEVTVEEGTPRILFNRECENGLWNADETESHLIESTQEGWSSKYFSQSGNVWSVDLKQMVADKGFAHLHAIKAPWDTQITVTKMELVENGDIVLPEAYAVLSEGNTVLTFYYDVNKNSHDGAMSVVPFSSGGARGWDSNSSNITKVEFDKSFANCLTLTSTACWFTGCDHLTAINGTRRIKTADVTEMWGMFLGCSSLTSLDLSSFNTAKVSTMQQMFFGCSALTTVYVGSGWNLENMSYDGAVFEGCTSLVGGYGTTYDASSIDYTYAHIDEGSSNPGYFTGREPLTREMMFGWDGFGADAQKTNLGSFACVYYLGKSTDIPYGDSDLVHFADLSSYSRLEVLVTEGTPRFLFNRDETDGQPSENEAESHLIDSGHEGCMTWASKYFTSVTTEGGTLWSVNLKQMVEDKGFAHLHAIKGTGDSNITVTKMELFVAQNTAFEPEPYAVLSDNNSTVEDTETGEITNAKTLTFFYDNKKTERNGLSVGPFDNSYYDQSWYDNREKITNVVFDDSFSSCTSITSTANWFYFCYNLTTITGIGNLKTDNVTNMSGMFYSCSRLTELDVTGFKTDRVKDMSTMFASCSVLTSLDVKGFKTDSVTNMHYMFANCHGLSNIDLSGFNTESVTDMSGMFFADDMSSLDLSSFNTSNVTNMSGMFQLDLKLRTIYVGDGWTTSSVNSSNNMFMDSGGIVGGRGTKYNSSYTDHTYARIDEGPSNPGYFTRSGDNPYGIVDLVNNGDMEGDDVSNYFVKIDRGDISQAVITDGVGVNNSRGIKVEASARVSEDYDNQFWVRSNKPISEGSKIRVSFDYRADQDASVGVECHAEPGDYIYWSMFEESLSFETDWKHFTYENEVSSNKSSDEKPLHSFAFDLSKLEYANNYYFDNIKFEVVLGGQCPKPTFTKNDDTLSIQSPFNATIYYTTDGSEPTTNSDVYSVPLLLSMNATVKAIAVVDGCEHSPVAIYEFVAVPEPYAVLSDNNTVLTFYNDTKKKDRNGMSVGPFGSGGNREWYYYLENLTEVVFDESFANYYPTSTAYWFEGCTSLTSITGIENLKTDSVTSMWGMFENCSKLTNLDVSGFKTDNVTNLCQVFYGCSLLTVLDMRGFKTDKVTDMVGLFYKCSGLTTIYVGDGWSTQAVTLDDGMFRFCYNLVGGQGTVYNGNHTDVAYAHIDGGPSNPGYFTLALSMGDANGDGSINIADAVATVTNILGQPADGNFYKYAADMNNDSFIDIFDVTMIVNAVFDANTPAPAFTRGHIDNVPVEAIRLTADANHIYMGVDQAQQYTAFQFDIDLPEGTELVDVRLSGMTDHQLSFVKRGESEYRVVALSMNNEVFRPTNGHLIQLQVSNMAGEDQVKVSNMLFVTPAGKTITGISDCLNATMAKDASIYNLQGEKVGNNMQQLGKGIYIVNHKKVIIK